MTSEGAHSLQAINEIADNLQVTRTDNLPSAVNLALALPVGDNTLNDLVSVVFPLLQTVRLE